MSDDDTSRTYGENSVRMARDQRRLWMSERGGGGHWDSLVLTRPLRRLWAVSMFADLSYVAN
jgi:hypothetical protein